MQILNWNIAGAKYLELPSDRREEFRRRINHTLQGLIEGDKPVVVTLQEVVRYHENGDMGAATDVVDVPDGYNYFPLWLIDTRHQSAKGKWDKVREVGGWPANSFFAQGNAFLIRNDVPVVRVFDLPKMNCRWQIENPIEIVKLESGLYLGTRDTEPRAAMIAHLVLGEHADEHGRCALDKPLDVFVVNLHLTTLMQEREGVPRVDEAATKKRSGQLEIILNGIVSPYNSWRRDDYKFSGRKSNLTQDETDGRHNPIWVIAGDFNFTPESTEYKKMVRGGFIDLIPNHDLGTKTSGLGRRPTLTVDYVFAGPRFASIDPGFAAENITHNHVLYNDRVRISDHLPLIVSVPIALPEMQRRSAL